MWEFSILLLVFALLVESYKTTENANFFEGDMILSPDQLREIKKGKINRAIPLAAAKTTLWPRTIPYDYGELESTPGRAVVDEAISIFEKHTCLRFVKRTTQRGYLTFFKGQSCNSHVGFAPMRRRISLGPLCWNYGVAVHEMMHALGFYHEQSRPDRNLFVKIRIENILPGTEFNFKKYGKEEIDSLDIPYDYASIMHYGSRAFSKNQGITIETLDPSKQDVIGQRSGLSKLDIQQINLLYKCHGSTVSPRITKEPPCLDQDVSTCSKFKAKCSDKKDPWHKWFLHNCKKTCGSCATGLLQSSDVNDQQNSAECRDSLVNCDAYIQKCTSADSTWKNFLKKYCPKTCSYCGHVTKTTTTPWTTRKVTATSKSTITAGNPYCFDRVTNCKGYVAVGYCNPKSVPYFHQYMKKNCVKSCGWCVTVLPPIGTPPPWPKECGIPSYQTSKVIGGIDAKPGAWPWQARLYKTNTYASYCGASLISTNWLVTAAHCVKGRSAKDITIHLGLHNLAKEDKAIQEIPVRQIIIHPSYGKPSRMNNDIALLQLVRPAILNDRVKAVCLPHQDKPVKVGAKCYLTGWGKTKHPGGPSLILQQTDLDVVDSNICHTLNFGNYRIPITKGMVCAGLGHNTIQGGCHGDSGGPMVCKENGKFVLHGDVSWGSHTCDVSKGYTVFGRVSYYRAWMDQFIYS